MGIFVTANFAKGRVCVTPSVFQYNAGMKLRFMGAALPDTYRVDFSNTLHGKSKPMIGNADGVEIPYEYFVPGQSIYAWIVVSFGENDAITEYQVTIPVSPRAKPTNETPTPTQQSALDQAIAALNEGVTRAEAAADSAEEAVAGVQETVDAALEAAKESGEFDGPQGPQGVPGPQGNPGADYVLTSEDKAEIASMVDIVTDNTLTEPGKAADAKATGIELGQLKSALEEEIDIARVSSLDSTVLAKGSAIEAVGIPVYADNVSQYAAYGITDKGWYVFARVAAPAGASVTAQTTITGAAGYIAAVGDDHIDLAVRFDTTAQSVPVTINWGTETDHFTFKASDLAVRNLDYRVTFYIYDITPYCVWTYALTSDTTFVAGNQYYTKDGDVYTLAEVTAGEAVPADTYYKHSLLHLEGMVPNVTYKLDNIVDCPIEITLPDVADDGHGAWFEIQMRYNGSYSCTLLPPEGVKIGTAQTQAQGAGINTIDLQYTVAGNVKMWTLLNTHSNIPA